MSAITIQRMDTVGPRPKFRLVLDPQTEVAVGRLFGLTAALSRAFAGVGVQQAPTARSGEYLLTIPVPAVPDGVSIEVAIEAAIGLGCTRVTTEGGQP